MGHRCVTYLHMWSTSVFSVLISQIIGLSGDIYKGKWEKGKATGAGSKMTIDGTNIEGNLPRIVYGCLKYVKTMVMKYPTSGLFLDGLAHGWIRKVSFELTSADLFKY